MYVCKKTKILIKIIGILILTSMMNFSTILADTIRIKADSWCPYNCEPDALKPGYTIEALKIIFENKGHTIEYSTTLWAQALNLARRGMIEAVVGASKNEVQNLIFPEEELGFSKT